MNTDSSVEIIPSQTINLPVQEPAAWPEAKIERMMTGWTRVLGLTNQNTGFRARRMLDWTETLARKIGLQGQELSDIRRGVLLHDIGMIQISDAILNKPRSLDAEEWHQVRKHPLFAWEMLAALSALRGCSDIPYCHHEHWDGSGYPRGLQGEDIPLAARIFSVVDVWDALRSRRPDRKAWSEEQAVAYLQQQSGKLFDPRILPVFLEIISVSEEDGALPVCR